MQQLPNKQSIRDFLSGILVIVVLYYVLNYLLLQLQPRACEHGWLCTEDAQNTVLLVTYIGMSLALGYYRNSKKS